MSLQSSTFLSERQPGDCRPKFDIIIHHDGVSSDLPVIEAGMLVCLGGIANVPSRGIGHDGLTAGGFKIPYNAILGGGAGVKVRCPSTDAKQRIRFTVNTQPQVCGGFTNPVVSLQLQALDTCSRAFQYASELPLHTFRRCSTMETDCQILEEMARQFNRDYSHIGVAIPVMDGSVYALDIETLNFGETFGVEAHEGLSNPRLIVPANRRTFTRSLIQDAFGTMAGRPVVYTGTDGNLSALEITFEQQVGTSMTGVATSNMNTDTTTYTPIRTTVVLTFEDNTNANAQLAKYKALLQGPGSGNGAAPYLSKIVDATCVDALLYPYTVVRTDAGDAAAFASAKTAYATNQKVFHRAGYVAGKSYYEVYTNSGTTPTADGSDTVLKGTSNVPQPYSISTCPPGTACASCPQV